MATSFAKTTWVDGAAPSITAAQLNRLETFLASVADGGTGSVAKADHAESTDELDIEALPLKDTEPDLVNDFLVIYEASSSSYKKISLTTLFTNLVAQTLTLNGAVIEIE